MADRAAVAILIARAKQLRCEYPAKGDTCDDHKRRGTVDFTPCDPCVVRRLAEYAERNA